MATKICTCANPNLERLFGGKPTTMSSELLATYAGLGTHDGERYYKGEECLGTCRDVLEADLVCMKYEE